MIDPRQIRKDQTIYKDQSGKTTVYYGWYTRVKDGTQESLQVAIKEICMKPEELGGLVQELLIQTKLEECKSICKQYGYFIEGMTISIISEWLAHDLDKDVKLRVDQHRPYPEYQLISMMRQIVTALLFAKNKSIAHRDIKPQNILLASEDGDLVKLVDFGSGSLVDGKIHMLTGTPLYMSPEQIPIFEMFRKTGMLPNTTYDNYQSDVYALGVTFLHVSLLEPPVRLLSDRENSVNFYLSCVKEKYPIVHFYLYNMLTASASERCSLEILNYSLNNSDTGETPTGDEEYRPRDTYGGDAMTAGQSYPSDWVRDAAQYQQPGQIEEAKDLQYSHGNYGQIPQDSAYPPNYSLVSNSPPFDQAQYPQSLPVSTPSSSFAPAYPDTYQQAPQEVAYPQYDLFDSYVSLDYFDPFANTTFAGMSRDKKLENLHHVFPAPTDPSEITSKITHVRGFGIQKLFFCGVFFQCEKILMEEDFYQVLRVPRVASRSEISKAYRHLALRYHPDKTADPTALSHFLRISEAYNTLKNDNSRSKYDFETTFSSLFQLFRSQPVTVNKGSVHPLFTDPQDEVDDMDSFAKAFSEAQHCKICFFPLPKKRHRLHFLTEHFADFSRWKGRRTVPPEKKRKT